MQVTFEGRSSSGRSAMPLSDRTKNQILDMIKKEMQQEIDEQQKKKADIDRLKASAAGLFYIKLPYIKNPYIKIPYLKF
jgi:hypothetical protein